MAKALQNEGVEYEDGTPATISQQAKDVTTFLAWAGEPKNDERKQLALKLFTLLFVAIVGMGYWKRFRWSIVKGRRVSYV